MEIRNATTTIELTLTLNKREAFLLKSLMLRNITFPELVAQDIKMTRSDIVELSGLMENIGLALMAD